MPQLTRRRAATLARLMEAAIDEFARNGIDATSIEQLCEAAGFTRGAFYSNFASKDDFCLELSRQLSEETVRNLDAWLEELPAEIPEENIVPTLLGSQSVSPELSLTLRELDLRATRSPEFGVRYRALKAEMWEHYRRFVATATERAGVEFTISTDDLLHLLRSLYEYPDDRVPAEPGRSTRLMNAVVRAFRRPTR